MNFFYSYFKDIVTSYGLSSAVLVELFGVCWVGQMILNKVGPVSASSLYLPTMQNMSFHFIVGRGVSEYLFQRLAPCAEPSKNDASTSAVFKANANAIRFIGVRSDKFVICNDYEGTTCEVLNI